MGVAGKRGEDADVEDEDENVGVCPPDDPGGEPEPDPERGERCFFSRRPVSRGTLKQICRSASRSVDHAEAADVEYPSRSLGCGRGLAHERRSAASQGMSTST